MYKGHRTEIAEQKDDVTSGPALITTRYKDTQFQTDITKGFCFGSILEETSLKETAVMLRFCEIELL